MYLFILNTYSYINFSLKCDALRDINGFTTLTSGIFYRYGHASGVAI